METMFKSAFFVCLVYLLLLNTVKKTFTLTAIVHQQLLSMYKSRLPHLYKVNLKGKKSNHRHDAVSTKNATTGSY